MQITRIPSLNGRSFIICLLSLSAFISFNSCNPGVFVDDLDSDLDEIEITALGGSSTVHISDSGDWEIISVTSYPGGGFFYGEIYDEASGEVTDNQPLSLKGHGHLMYSDRFGSFIISRSDDNSLSISLSENLSTNDFRFRIRYGNSYAMGTVIVTQEGGEGFEVESLEWEYEKDSWSSYLAEAYNQTISNSSSDTITISYCVLSDLGRKVKFDTEDYSYLSFLPDKRMPVLIPSGISADSLLVFASDTAELVASLVQTFDFGMEPIYKSIAVPPGISVYTIILGYEEFSARLHVSLKSISTETRILFSFSFISKTPTGEVFIIRKDEDN